MDFWGDTPATWWQRGNLLHFLMNNSALVTRMKMLVSASSMNHFSQSTPKSCAEMASLDYYPSYFGKAMKRCYLAKG